jgi:hypothetical protein
MPRCLNFEFLTGNFKFIKQNLPQYKQILLPSASQSIRHRGLEIVASRSAQHQNLKCFMLVGFLSFILDHP